MKTLGCPALCLTSLGLLAACGDHTANPAAPAAAQTPLTPALQSVYDRSCRNCHTVPSSGAPQAGDVRAWAPRVTQGAEVLLDHTFDGYRSMPPMGACMDCTEDQYLALIEYMSGTRLPRS